LILARDGVQGATYPVARPDGIVAGFAHALSDVGFRLELVDVGEKLARGGKEVDT
jgi:hypothetical protein